MMKKIVLTFFTVLMLFLGVFAYSIITSSFNQTKNNTSVESSTSHSTPLPSLIPHTQFRAYSNSKVGYSISYPSDWVLTEEDSFVSISNPQLPSVGVIIEPNNREEVWNNFSENSTKSSLETRINLGKVSVFKQDTKKEDGYLITKYVSPNSSNLYLITLTVTDTEEFTNSKILSEILSTFSFSLPQ